MKIPNHERTIQNAQGQELYKESQIFPYAGDGRWEKSHNRVHGRPSANEDNRFETNCRQTRAKVSIA